MIRWAGDVCPHKVSSLESGKNKTLTLTVLHRFVEKRKRGRGQLFLLTMIHTSTCQWQLGKIVCETLFLIQSCHLAPCSVCCNVGNSRSPGVLDSRCKVWGGPRAGDAMTTLFPNVRVVWFWSDCHTCTYKAVEVCRHQQETILISMPCNVSLADLLPGKVATLPAAVRNLNIRDAAVGCSHRPTCTYMLSSSILAPSFILANGSEGHMDIPAMLGPWLYTWGRCFTLLMPLTWEQKEFFSQSAFAIWCWH